ncbi:MAG: flagellar hook protein FlgE [Spirochaetaceae bacterium]|jgi:flagellar hook protein FlgE|nr:flagellar hook protein FlgE [Spirochaetaceae bacterium]
MMRSLFSGVSGLQNHQTRMDVIGNNISNINTNGYKKGRVNFQDLLYQQSAAASRPTDTVGGVNPKEIGLGMSLAAIDTIHTQGSLQTTGVGTDLAIQGTGFFVLSDGANQYFTRAGDFNVDANGTFVNPANGYKVQGWMADETGAVNTAGDVGDLTLPIGSKNAARATAEADLMCNLDKRTTAQGEAWGTSINIYDSFGNPHTLQIQFEPVMNAAGNSQNVWNATVYVDPAVGADGVLADGVINGVPLNTAVGATQAAGAAIAVPAAGAGTQFTLYFSNLGTLESVAPGAIAQGTDQAHPAAGAAGTDVTLNVAYDVPNTTTGVPERQTMALNLGTVGGLTNTVTQYAEASSTKFFNQDGYAMGYLENFKIDGTGTITGVYTNGTTTTLGRLAMASFTNQSGLEHAGDTAFQSSTNSGTANIGVSAEAGKGKIVAGTLEMSNVDMSESFVDMITTQRGFQANSRTITTSDEMLQELLNLKR